MTYVVTDVCIGVRGEACMEVCPEYCIVAEPADHMSFIDPARCTDCGACAEACVVNAIYADKKVPRASAEFIHLNESWFRAKKGVRKRVKEIGIDLGQLLPDA
jgi:ferredoxin--NADP+ reductase